MVFSLGEKSLGFIEHVDPRTIEVAKLAISLSTQDFGFTQEQSRTLAEEQVLVDKGVSHTLRSHHIIDCESGWAEPGCSGAVDAVPWNGAAFVWEWPLIYPIAVAFKAASLQLDIPITWGGVWDRLMIDIPGDDAAAMQAAVQAYAARQAAAGNHHVLLDGPHYEFGRN